MSASNSILPDGKSNQQFSCFRASAEFIQIPHVTDGPDDYRLVHGNVATLSQDVPVNHAWIEEIDFVYEFSEGRKILFSKDDYYKKKQNNQCSHLYGEGSDHPDWRIRSLGAMELTCKQSFQTRIVFSRRAKKSPTASVTAQG